MSREGQSRCEVFAEVEVANVGGVAGDEVVQLYVEDVVCTFVTPVKRLQDFQRISLQAGEKRTVRFEIQRQFLEQLDQRFERRVEAGEFKIQIAGSSVSGMVGSLWVEE